jgi:hypothetical protein
VAAKCQTRFTVPLDLSPSGTSDPLFLYPLTGDGETSERVWRLAQLTQCEIVPIPCAADRRHRLHHPRRGGGAVQRSRRRIWHRIARIGPRDRRMGRGFALDAHGRPDLRFPGGTPSSLRERGHRDGTFGHQCLHSDAFVVRLSGHFLGHALPILRKVARQEKSVQSESGRCCHQ